MMALTEKCKKPNQKKTETTVNFVKLKLNQTNSFFLQNQTEN